MQTRIRLARPDEVEAVGALTVEAFRASGMDVDDEDYASTLADAAGRAQTCHVLVALVGGEQNALAGAVTYVPGPGPYAEFPEEDWAGLRMLAVESEWQGQGIGAALVRACIDRAEQAARAGIALHTTPLHTTPLHTTPVMETAARLYARMGFRRASHRDFQTTSGQPLLGYEWVNPDLEPTGAVPTTTTTTTTTDAKAHAPAIDVAVVPGDHPDVTMLVHELMAELELRYGPSDPCADDPFRPSDIDDQGRVLLARADGAPVGTATLRPRSDTEVELKRMLVTASARGLGVGRALLQSAETTAQALGFTRLVLETGTRQPEAMRMYRRAGYRAIEPYGWYRNEPLSRCFAKTLEMG